MTVTRFHLCLWAMLPLETVFNLNCPSCRQLSKQELFFSKLQKIIIQNTGNDCCITSVKLQGKKFIRRNISWALPLHYWCHRKFWDPVLSFYPIMPLFWLNITILVTCDTDNPPMHSQVYHFTCLSVLAMKLTWQDVCLSSLMTPWFPNFKTQTLVQFDIPPSSTGWWG